jgi:glutathione-regulated potassium-efflux system protein KefB
MEHATLLHLALLLAAAAIAAPLARWLKVGTVLGYLAAGVLLGPFGIGQVFSIYQAKEILHISEFGVVLLLFLIGLELRPGRLWSMRTSIFGLGGAQVLLSALALAGIGWATGMALPLALFLGLALSLSSTAFALQVLEEKGELKARHGRLAFSVLLFQDLAAIPLIAIVPLFAVASASGGGMDLIAAAKALATILIVVAVGHYLIDHGLRLVARTGVKEAMTAAALLTVVGASVVMQEAGLSASLGAFLAGALLAESSYRHQLHADIQPFEGLLLGLFFTAIGMSLKLGLIAAAPLLVLGFVVGLTLVKALILYALGRWQGLDDHGARRLALSISQGGEFAFVLLTQGVAASVLDQRQADLTAVVVTLSMALTPLLLIADEMAQRLRTGAAPKFDEMPENDGHVIIAGFGRVGQIAGRILRARGIPFTALDFDAEQIAMVKRFGAEAFFGDPSRPDILEAAGIARARAILLTMNDVEASLRTAGFVRRNYPHLTIYARARNRAHVHQLMDLGVHVIRRETFLSALDLTAELLRGIGVPEAEVKFTVDTFREHDERRLQDEFRHFNDEQKLQAKARSDAETLAGLFSEDRRERSER